MFEKDDVRRLVHTLNQNSQSPLDTDRLNRTFDLCWPGLKAEISAIDFTVSAPIASESSASAAGPPQEQIQILQLVAERADYECDAEGIARATETNITRTKHYLDQLVRNGLLHDAQSYLDPTTYGLTEAGREVLVAKGLV